MGKSETKKYSTLENSIYMLKAIKKVIPLGFWLMFLIVPFGVLGHYFSIYLPKVLISGIEMGLEPIQIFKNISIVVLLLIIMKTTEIIIEFTQYALGINMRSYFSMDLYQEKLMDIDYSYLVAGGGMEEQSKVMEIVFTGDGSFVHRFHQHTGVFLTSIVGVIFYGSLISSINHWLIIVIFIGAIINLIYGKYNANYRQKSIEKRSMDAKRLNYIQSKTGDFRSAKDMRLFEMKDWFMDNFQYYLSRWSKEYKKQKQMNAVGGIIDALIIFIRDGLAYLFLIGLYFSGEITISDFVLLFGAIVGFSEWLSNIVEQINDYVYYSSQINIMRNFFEKEDDLNRGERQYKANLNKAPSIEFKNVSFKYGEDEEYVLKDFNLKIPSGEKIALVGVNGAGKTTIVSLLMRLLKPTDGEILVNGVSQDEYNIYDYYSLFSTVFQDIYIMPDTILNNITSGEEPDMEKAYKALKDVGLLDFINGLPEKQNTYLVRTSRENAIDLSGGQAQRLLLARALYKNGPISILDEPTAALDPIAESEIYEEYNDMTENKTAIFISHRLASTKFCNRILFLENGEIVEEGTHKELMAKNGKYSEMFEIQSHYYREDMEATIVG
jgi:ATP-binding cassette subfamily B protein